METHIFAHEAKAYDIADSLTDIVFKDDRGNSSTVRMNKDAAKKFRDQLSEMLAKPPLSHVESSPLP